MKTHLALAAALLLAGPGPGREEVLENDFVRASVDPVTGAITSLLYKKAATFPLIADKGAGVAGTGAFFVPRFEGAGVALQGSGLRREKDDLVLRLTGGTLERTVRLAKGESALRIADAWKGPGRVGQISRRDAEPWRQVARSWYGDAGRVVARALPADDKGSLEARPGPVFWRMVGPYGTGFLARTAGLSGAALGHASRKSGEVEFSWEASVSGTVETWVLVDEGGREGNDAAALAKGEVIVTVDLRAAGSAGETLPAFATVVSASARKVALSVAVSADGKESKELLTVDLSLEPGKARLVSVEVKADRKGVLALGAGVADLATGAVVATGQASAVIDGEGPVWEAYQRKIPSAVYRGSWAEIGAQLARAGRLKPRAPDSKAAERRSFYEKHFPIYAEIIKGAAQATNGKPEDFAHARRPEAEIREACMDVFLNGPDGPINAFSKERSGTGMGGLAYMKVVPDKGYAYHVYECGTWQNGYGVNSEGLSTSGASINCDGPTTSAGHKATAEWRAAGRMTVPLGSHLMLATCRDVEEAVRFIESPLAPFEFEGNMLLVDRAGNAARMESVGIRRQIHRYDPKKDRIFAAGNYPHEDGSGLFKVGPDWGWAANTMMRERLLEELAGARQGRISLREAFSLMESHGVGGMCQHVHDNPGRLHTSNSFLAVCRTGDLWLSHGPPCRVRYTRFTLKDGE